MTTEFNVDCDDIDPSLVRFLIPIVPEKEQMEQYEKDYQPTMDKIRKLGENYVRKTEMHFEFHLDDISKTTKYQKPIYKYILNEMQNIRLKLNSLKENFYSKKAILATTVLSFLMESHAKNIPILFDVEAFKKATAQEFKSLESITTEVKHYRMFCVYLNNQSSELEKRFDINNMRQILVDSAENVDMSQEYSPYGDFDDVFVDFVEWSKAILRFDQSVQTVVENTGKRLINMRDLDVIKKSFAMLFLPVGAAQRLVLTYAINRVFFDEIALVPGYFLFSEIGSEEFNKNCAILRKKTPVELEISPSLMKPEMMDVPFEDIVANSETLLESSRNLNSIHFITNPYDITYTAFKAIKLIDNFVVDNKGLDKTQAGSSNMSFDDVFSLFCPVMAIDPPKNCVSLADFFSRIDGLRFSSSLDFAKLLVSSSVDYIVNYDKQ